MGFLNILIGDIGLLFICKQQSREYYLIAAIKEVIHYLLTINIMLFTPIIFPSLTISLSVFSQGVAPLYVRNISYYQ